MILCAMSAIVLGLPILVSAQTDAPGDDWAVAPGFALVTDATGFQFPTVIAFVPEPGQGADDPRYFVAELFGTIKVVTNDGSVYPFATDLGRVYREAAPPDVRGELGLAGLCLHPEHGYVFATFVGYDDAGVLRNHIRRFETEPQTFGLSPRAQTPIADIFADHPTSFNHAVGPCAVAGDTLFVGVGDAFDPSLAASLESVSGKVLRMSLDGLPLADNPHAVDDDPGRVANYVWASGFRNPYSLAVVDDQVFAADNGETVDRFLALPPGASYLWDGDGASFAANADYLFLDSIAPTQMTAIAQPGALLPADFGSGFILATSTYAPAPGLLFLPYDFAGRTVPALHRSLVGFAGAGPQRVVAAAVGSDAIYFAPFIGDETNGSPLFKLRYDPDNAHPRTLSEDLDGASLLVEKGCNHCHTVSEHVATVGPSLNRAELTASVRDQLDAPGYAARLAELDARTDEPFVSTRAARHEVLAAQGDEQVRLWLTHRLLEPKFDNANAQMPNLHLSQEEAEALAAHLIPARTVVTALYDVLDTITPELHYRHLLLYFTAGFAFASLLAILAWVFHKLIVTRDEKRTQ